VRNPQLTAFCTELTSISQQQVDAAQSFPEVMSKLTDWMNLFPNNIF
jgi:inhibitor of KinA sporulation pathway (predicted exonuclease)